MANSRRSMEESWVCQREGCGREVEMGGRDWVLAAEIEERRKIAADRAWRK